jgi:hypothetical protein
MKEKTKKNFSIILIKFIDKAYKNIKISNVTKLYYVLESHSSIKSLA